MNVAVVIPFRDRGLDPLRSENLDRVLKQWFEYEIPAHVSSDGRSGDAQFNRSAAYNQGRFAAKYPDVVIYAESDMLVPISQVMRGIELAMESPGLVVPFTTYKYLSADDSVKVRSGRKAPEHCNPQTVMRNGSSIGAINIVSKETLDLVGQWDEHFEGNWYDDNAMERAFQVCCGTSTRFVRGDAHHLYHLPGWTGEHLSEEDKLATARNKERYEKYLQANDADEIRKLTTEKTV